MTPPVPAPALADGAWRLDRLSGLGIRWAWLLGEVGPLVHPDHDPWVAHPLDLAASIPLPAALPPGPAVYAPLGFGQWQYAGQTVQQVVERLGGHARDRDAARRHAKAACWQALASVRLVETATPGDIGRVERAALEYLRPRMGQRWARGRVRSTRRSSS